MQLESPWVDNSALHELVLPELYGPDGFQWLPVTRAEAMAVPAVARARSVLCPTLGRLDLVATVPNGPTAPTPESVNFLRQPDPAQSRFIMITWTVDDLIFHGVSWWYVTSRYASGAVQNCQRIVPGGVVLQDGGGVEVYGKPVDAKDVKRIDGPHEGILNSASRTIRAAARLERSAANFADNPIPAIELHQTDDFPMTPEMISDLIKEWRAARAGRDGGVAYTPRSISVIPHGAPVESLLTDGRNAAALDMARHIGVPGDAVDAESKSGMTYSNVEMKSRNLIDYGIGNYGFAIEARLSMDDMMAHGTVARFDYSNLTAASNADAQDDVPEAPSA